MIEPINSILFFRHDRSQESVAIIIHIEADFGQMYWVLVVQKNVWLKYLFHLSDNCLLNVLNKSDLIYMLYIISISSTKVKIMQNLIIIFTLLRLAINLCDAQQLPRNNDFQELGISFDVPPGWTAQIEGEIILMGHESIPGLMLMSENQASNVAELKQMAQAGIIEEGVHLTPVGEFKNIGSNRLEGHYQGTFNGQSVKAFALAMIDQKGKGVNVMIVTSSNQFDQIHQNEAKKLAASVKFYQAIESDKTQEWKNYIVGQKLTYMKTTGGSDYGGGYSGTSDKIEIQLCGTGRFVFYANSHSSFDDSAGMGYVNDNESNVGQYEISTPGDTTFLMLNFDDGKISEYVLKTNDKNHTLLNNRRYFVTDSDQCS